MALGANLRNNDIDACVVSETHIKNSGGFSNMRGFLSGSLFYKYARSFRKKTYPIKMLIKTVHLGFIVQLARNSSLFDIKCNLGIVVSTGNKLFTWFSPQNAGMKSGDG